MPKQDKEFVHITLKLRPETHLKFFILCKTEGITLQDRLEKYVNKVVDRAEKAAPETTVQETAPERAGNG